MEPQSSFDNQCTSLIVELRRLGEILPLLDQLIVFTHAEGLRECSEQLALTFHSKPQRAQRHIQRCRDVLHDIDLKLGELWLKLGHNKYLNDEVHRVWRLTEGTSRQAEPVAALIHDRIVTATVLR
jgi:hypothetical protein